ncbi:MAG: DUF975 family protein [Spirochaetes bacterium]|nr:DUF975 family protein [Spirochaetota bacterium]
MLDRKALKQAAKDRLKGKWGTAVLVTLVYILVATPLGLLSNIKELGDIRGLFNIASLFITAPMYMGLSITYIALVKHDTLQVGNLFGGFKIYGKSLGMYLWMLLWIFLWALLFVVPGIIKALSYSQCIYIIADNPKVKVTDALRISMKMTDGYKWDIFVMGLSFIGWMLLTVLTVFIGLLWLFPYMAATYTSMYFRLRELGLQSGKCTEEMLNGAISPVK